MNTGNGNGRAANGSGAAASQIHDLADGCVRHVERALGVKLDYQPETLPLLDHYLRDARAEAQAKPEILTVIAQTAGAYLGEVVRRRHSSWWRMDGRDPSEWRIEFEEVYLAFYPVQLVIDALLRGGSEASLSLEQEGGVESESESESGGVDISQLELEEEDHAAVASRLAELPPVSEDEFYAPSTRVEVIDIAVEAIRARKIAAEDDVDARLRPEDYEPED